MELWGAITMRAFQRDTIIIEPRTLSYGTCVSRRLQFFLTRTHSTRRPIGYKYIAFLPQLSVVIIVNCTGNISKRYPTRQYKGAAASKVQVLLLLGGVTSDVAPRDPEHVDKAPWANVAGESGSGSGRRQSSTWESAISRGHGSSTPTAARGDQPTRGRQGAPRCCR